MTHLKSIRVADIGLDFENARLPEIEESTIDSIMSIMKREGEKVVVLANHIVKYGLNPTELSMVIENDGGYTVVDGNRRISALKLLETPEILNTKEFQKYYKSLLRLSKSYSKDPIKKVLCCVFEDQEDADIWIELNHTGENDGAGRVKWSSQQITRWLDRRGKKSITSQILDFVKSDSRLSDKTTETIDSGNYKTTTLERLISTPYVREKLGIDLDRKVLYRFYPSNEIKKGLVKVVNDIGEGKIKVDNIKTVQLREEYIDGFKGNDLPNRRFKSDVMEILDPTVNDEIAAKHNIKKQIKRNKTTNIRRKLVPKDFNLSINVERIENILVELKELDIDKYTNSVAVLLRVFIEFSVDEYLKRKDEYSYSDSLNRKIKKVCDYMESQELIDRKYATAIKRTIHDPIDFSSTVALNDYVHNSRCSPKATELSTTWDNYREFLEKIWL